MEVPLRQVLPLRLDWSLRPVMPVAATLVLETLLPLRLVDP